MLHQRNRPKPNERYPNTKTRNATHYNNQIEEGIISRKDSQDESDKYNHHRWKSLQRRTVCQKFYFCHEWRQMIIRKENNCLPKKNAICLLLLLFVFTITIRYSCRRLPSTTVQEKVKFNIDLFDASKIQDLGGFLYPAKYQKFASYKRIMKLSDDHINATLEYVPDYGGLDYMKLLSRSNFQRTIEITDDDAVLKHEQKSNHDDDRVDEKETKKKSRSHFLKYADDDTIPDDSCRRTEFHQLITPNCNFVHEMDLKSKLHIDIFPYEEHAAALFSHGFYRDAWSMITPATSPYMSHDENSIVKTFRMKHPFNQNAYENARKDALIMERLTKSPRIIDIYAHCGLTVVVEEMTKEFEEYAVPGTGFIKQEDLDAEDSVQSQNTFTPTQKLQMSLEMAESLADLHGFEGGVIVHDDVQLCQWLHDKDGKLKLGDFNRAQVMLWDEENKQYCKYNRGKAYGDYRSPEEFAAQDLDEKVDVYSLGNNMYSLLTGLWPFYSTDDDKTKQKMVIDGDLPFIDERFKESSFAERKLVELIEMCWTYDSDKRLTIFDLVTLLRQAKKENEQLK